MKVLVCGAGAVGIGIATAIASTGNEVHILARSKTMEIIRQEGIKRTGILGEVHVQSSELTIYESLEHFSGNVYDYVLICTKTTTNYLLATELNFNRELLSKNSKIVILQNGWGNDEQYIKFFDVETIYNGRVITGFERTAPHVSNITVHAAPILIGSLFGRENSSIEELVKAIDSGGIPCESSKKIEAALWAKMLYNCALNPLGAILKTNYGALAESNYSVSIMDSIIDEIFEVLTACNLKTFWSNATEYKDAFYKELIPTTYHHRSSTLQDIEKKIKTEIDTLQGSIIKLATKHEIKVPVNKTIYNLIKGLEADF